MDEKRIVKILKENYSLSELEERLGLEPEDLDDGYLYFVAGNMEEVLEMLREDLYVF